MMCCCYTRGTEVPRYPSNTSLRLDAEVAKHTVFFTLGLFDVISYHYNCRLHVYIKIWMLYVCYMHVQMHTASITDEKIDNDDDG